MQPDLNIPRSEVTPNLALQANLVVEHTLLVKQAGFLSFGEVDRALLY
jgi:hypothetical protein